MRHVAFDLLVLNFCKQGTAYEIRLSRVVSEMCLMVRDVVAADTAAAVLGQILGPQSTSPAPAQCTELRVGALKLLGTQSRT